MQPKNIFFDFDGVLLDTIEAKGRAIAKAFEDCGPTIYSQVYNYHLNNGGMNRRTKIQECHKLFLGKVIPEPKLEELLSIVSIEMKKELYACSPVKGSLEFMKKHKESSGRAWIVSAAPEDEVKSLCEHFGYSKHVESIYGFPNKKTDCIHRIIVSEKLKLQECLLVGDAKEDFVAAEANKISFLLRRTSYSSFAKDYLGNSITDFTEAERLIANM